MSRQIATDYDVVYCEDLNIKNMTKSAKGTKDHPGTNVKDKSGLNRATQSRFKCVRCGHSDNADVNAAKNIQARGNRVFRRGGYEVAQPLKRHQVGLVGGADYSL